MNDRPTDLNDDGRDVALLMREATQDLDVPVGRLAAGGVRRGRIAVRRRRAGTAFAAAAVLGCVGVGYLAIPHGGGSGTGISFATAPPTTKVSNPAPDGPPGSDRRLATPQVILQRILDRLPEGPVTRTQTELGLDSADGSWSGVRISFRLDGALVSFSVDDPSAGRREHGLSELTAGNECQSSQPMPAGCRELADGSWQDTYHRATGGQGVPADRVENDASYWTADGWRIYSTAYNATGEKTGTKVGDEPPLSVEQLIAIARSDIWFR